MRVAAVSGGCDSVAATLLWWRQGIDFDILFCDSGVEFPEVPGIIERLSAITGKRAHVVSNGSFPEHLEKRDWHWPSMKRRWCTSDLKIVPQDAWYATHDVEAVAVGIRDDEVERIGKVPGHGYEVVYPLVEAGYDKPMAKALCEEYGLLHPSYAWRTNVSCWCCPFQNVSDWRGLLAHYPSLYAKAEEWERMAFASGRTEGLMRTRTLRELREGIERQGVLC